MKNKKVLFICQFFYPEKVSSGILPFELASELAKKGYAVYALVGYPDEYTDNEEVPKKEVVNDVNIKRIKYLTFKRSNIIGRLINYISFCISVFFHFKDFWGVDYCISYTNPPLLPPLIAFFSKIFKFKYIFEIYDLYPDTAIKARALSENSLATKIFNFATNYALKEAWKIVVLSDECKRYLLNSRNLNETKICVIPNWYKEQKVIQKHYPKKKIKVLYGGNMGVMQDMETIKSLVLKLKDDNRFEFIFAGHGSKKDYLEKSLKENQVSNYTMFDFLPKEEYDKLLGNVDLALLSLEKFGTGLGSPSKLYGYLAMGIPVIAILDSSTDIAKDIDKYGNGIHIDNGEFETLLKKLNILFENQKKIQEMSINSLKLFNEKYTLSKVVSMYDLLINEVLK